MNKKMFFSVAAAATLLMSNPFLNKADAASNTQVVQYQTKVIYQSGNLNADQINNLINKYLTSVQNLVPTTEQAQIATQKAPKAPTTTKAPTTAKAPTTTTSQNTSNAQVSTSVSAFEQKVVELTNNERAKYGLTALKLDVELSKVARAKSNDMKAKGYFDHNSPTYGSPFDMMKSFGITYRTAGENIAMGQTSPEEVVKAWMNSEGHRKNILSADFTHIGVGHVASGNYWTQMFIGK